MVLSRGPAAKTPDSTKAAREDTHGDGAAGRDKKVEDGRWRKDGKAEGNPLTFTPTGVQDQTRTRGQDQDHLRTT